MALRASRLGGKVLLPPVVLVVLLLSAGSASAHANLLEASPAPFARVASLPDELTLRFSEGLEDRYTSVAVESPDRRSLVRSFAIGEDRRSIRALLDPSPDGIVTVRWRALSVDSHTTSGVYLLAVNVSFASVPGHHGGNATNGTDPVGGGHSEAAAGEGAARALGFLGATLAAGIPYFVLLQGRRLPPDRRLALLGASGALLGAVAAIGLLHFIGGRIESSLLEAAGTQAGGRVAARAALLLGTGLALAAAAAAPRRAWFGAAATLGTGALVLTALASHAAARPSDALLAVVADALHQVGVAAWVGGVVSLVVVLSGRRGVGEVAHAVVERFSPFAIASVAVIVLTGLYASWLHVPEPGILLTTDYGRALLLKVLVLLPLLALGAANRYLFTPRLRAGKGLRGLRRSVAAEVLLMAVALAAAGVLANEAPPGTAHEGPHAGHGPAPDNATGPLAGLVHAFNASGHRIEVGLLPQPVSVGIQNLTVRVGAGPAGIPENALVYVKVLAPSDPDREGRLLELARGGNATWYHEGPLFVEEGRWAVEVVLQGRDLFAKGAFEVAVEPHHGHGH